MRSTTQSSSSPQSAVDPGSPQIASSLNHDRTRTDTPPILFEMKELELLHQWSVTTSLSIVNTPAVDYMWQIIFPQIALHHPFVMYGIFSVTALHGAYLDSSKRYRLMLDAASYHNKALEGFRMGIDHVSDENSDALFVSATLNIPCVFASFGKLYDDLSENPDAAARTSRILGAEWIPMIRGIRPVVHLIFERVKLGPLSSLLSLGNWDEVNPDNSPSTEDQRLRRIEEAWAGSDDAETYDESMQFLRKCYAWIAQFKTMREDVLAKWGYNRVWSGSFIWLHFAPDRYFVLLKQRQPPALLLFAYFGVLLHNVDGYWWAHGWGKSIITVIDELLGSYWRPWMEWPLQVVAPS